MLVLDQAEYQYKLMNDLKSQKNRIRLMQLELHAHFQLLLVLIIPFRFISNKYHHSCGILLRNCGHIY